MTAGRRVNEGFTALIDGASEGPLSYHQDFPQIGGNKKPPPPKSISAPQ